MPAAVLSWVIILVSCVVFRRVFGDGSKFYHQNVDRRLESMFPFSSGTHFGVTAMIDNHGYFTIYFYTRSGRSASLPAKDGALAAGFFLVFKSAWRARMAEMLVTQVLTCNQSELT